jgi:5-hydroxyisourate hydrolase-like protein (transthyretin family)
MLSRPRSLFFKVFLFSILFFSFVTYGFAQNLAGTVNNGTSQKPAAGVEVTLIKLAQGMEEAASTKTDAKGNFSFKLDDADGPHLVRATFQGATYFKIAPPGTSSVEVTVYDSAKTVEGISYTVDALQLEADGNQLRGTRTFAVNNQSKPPKTEMSDGTFEFYLPEGAEIDAAMAMAAGGKSVKASVVQRKERNLYAMAFPLRPGETKMQVGFHLPYSGSAEFTPKSRYPLDHFVVMVPKSMKFDAMSTPFQQITDGPGTSTANVQVVTQTKPNQSLAFEISGSGTLPAESGNGGDAQTGAPDNGGPTGQGMSSRPGGGLGPPSDAPDPLQNFRWYILGGFAALLLGGGYYVTQRNKNTDAMAATGGKTVVAVSPGSNSSPAAPMNRAAVAAIPSGNGSLLMQAMKEEIFQLEVDRQQGSISAEEYATAKAALDQTLARAIQRESRKS